jgi:hypothetical protein
MFDRLRHHKQPTQTAASYDEVLLQSYQTTDPDHLDDPEVNERYVIRLVSHGVLRAILGDRPEWPKSPEDFTNEELGRMCFDAVYHSVMMNMRRVETQTTFNAREAEAGGQILETRQMLKMGDPYRELTDDELSRAANEIDDFNPRIRPVNFAITLREPNPTDPEKVFWAPVVARLLVPTMPDGVMD